MADDLLKRARDVVRPLPFVLAPFVADPITDSFPLEPGEEAGERLNSAALAYLDTIAVPAFQRAARALNDLGLESRDGGVVGRVVRAHHVVFAAYAALGSIGHVDTMQEDYIAWACYHLVHDAYQGLLQGEEVANA